MLIGILSRHIQYILANSVCVYFLHFVLSSNRSSNSVGFFLTYHISGSIWDPSINCSIVPPQVVFHLLSTGCSLELFQNPPLFTPMKAMLFQHTDYQLTEWILLLSVRRCINVNHIRHKLIHLNSIETICVLKIALCTLANAERPVDMLWTTRTKCVLLFFFSVARFCLNCNLFWKLHGCTVHQ